MKTKKLIKAVVLLLVIAVLFLGCDFLQNGGSAAPPYELSKLTLTMSGKGVITATPTPLTGSSYPRGTTVKLTAGSDIRNSFWRFLMGIMFSNSGAVDSLNVSMFTNWTGDLVGTTNPASIQVNKDTSVQAVFSRQGVISITTSGGATTPGTMTPPTYAEIIYSAGRPLRADFYDSFGGTKYMTANFVFNSSGQCTVAYGRNPSGGAVLCTTNYTYTASGDIATMSVLSSSFSQSIQYEYDSLGRVYSMTMNMNTGSSWNQLVYCSYDDNGNMVQMDMYQNGTYSYYVCTTDPNGNVTNMAAYDQTGTPQPSQNMTLVYDANGLLSQASFNMGTSVTCILGWAPL